MFVLSLPYMRVRVKRSEKELTTRPKNDSEMVSDLHNAGYDLIQKVRDFKNIKKRLYRHINISLQIKKIRFKKLQILLFLHARFEVC